MSTAAFMDLLDRVAMRARKVRPAIERLARAAREAGIPCASHDDEAHGIRRWFGGLGVDICEFPLDAETARTALALGGAVVMGAPNVIRGGSHAERLPVADAARRGLCSILASDYYYPALLCAPFRLVQEGIMTLPEAWALVLRNPARARAGRQGRHRAGAARRPDRCRRFRPAVAAGHGRLRCRPPRLRGEPATGCPPDDGDRRLKERRLRPLAPVGHAHPPPAGCGLPMARMS